MQFRLSTLLTACTLAAVFCAIFFAVPLVVEIPILAMILLITPSIWICGACFAKGSWRAFFLGGICAGWVPHAILLYYAMAAAVSLVGDGDLDDLLGASTDFGILHRLIVAGCFLFPGVLAVIGGGCGMLIYRWFGEEPAKKPAAESSKLGEPYYILESRVTPAIRPNEETQTAIIE